MDAILATAVLAAAMFAGTNADTFVLLAIFSAQPGCRPRDLVGGALAGIGFLTALSAGASLLAVGVIHDWVPLLGLAPIFLGLAWLCRGPGRSAPAPALRWWALAGLIIADGADNLSVNLPVFALQPAAGRLVIAGVSVLLTLLLCLVAWSAARNPLWGPHVSAFCTRIAPFVLLAVGGWTLAHLPAFGLDFRAHPLAGF